MGQVSLDDFLSSQQERREKGIKTRWDINSTNEDFAPLLGELTVSSVRARADETLEDILQRSCAPCHDLLPDPHQYLAIMILLLSSIFC